MKYNKAKRRVATLCVLLDFLLRKVYNERKKDLYYEIYRIDGGDDDGSK